MRSSQARSATRPSSSWPSPTCAQCSPSTASWSSSPRATPRSARSSATTSRTSSRTPPLGTGHALTCARAAIPADTSALLVAYADTPLLRPESLRGLLNRHDLLGADLALLTAVVEKPLPYGRVARDASGQITGIVERSDLTPATDDALEINVGAYAAAPSTILAEVDALAGAGEHRLTVAVRRLIDDGAKVVTYKIVDTDEVQGINSRDELDAAADIVLRRLFMPRKNTDTHIVFGTGGWRAVIGEGYTLGNVRKLCQAIANEATRKGIDHLGVVIGGDRRFLSRESAEAAAEVFAGNNIPVTLLPDDVPTPLVTFAAPYLGAAYGIIITSSHNPPEWNGMKVFRADGSLPLDDETDRFQDEANALRAAEVITLDLELARRAGVVVDRTLTEPYVDAIEEIIDIDAVRGSGLRVVVDPMYGTSQLTLGTILTDMRVRAEFIHATHNPLFGGVAPAPDLERLSALIQMIKNGDGRYDLGMATDGDSDRIGIVDETGEYISTNDLLLLLYWYLHVVRGEKGASSGTSRRPTCSTASPRTSARSRSSARSASSTSPRAWRRSAPSSAASPRAASPSVAGSSARTASSRARSSPRCSRARASASPSCAR